MGTATSRRALAAAAVALGCAACGGASHGSSGGGHASGHRSSASAGHTVTSRQASAPAGPFAWLHPQAPPSGWRIVRIPTGAELPYPPRWRLVAGDRGTATATLLGTHGEYLGYLNLTPRQGNETLAGWPSFRPAHNADEGDRHVRRLASGTGLRFRTGQGSCVQDGYTTITGARFVEIACLVQGPTGSSVIVAAAPPNRWPSTSPLLERAIDGFTT